MTTPGDTAPASVDDFSALARANLSPVLGRYFNDTEDHVGSPHVVVLSAGLWRSRFKADSSIVGRTITLSGDAYTVVGVAPVMDAVLVRRVDRTEWIRESLFETVIGPLLNAAAPPEFVF